MALDAGPYREIPIEGGRTAPFYALRFDKKGRTDSAETQRHLVEKLAGGDYTDVYLFSHGWNNEWKTALDRYTDFMAEYRSLRERHGLSWGRPYRPLLAGIFWPSAALTMPWRQGPRFAGAEDDSDADRVGVSALRQLGEEVAVTDVARFEQLAGRERLAGEEARELLEIVLGSFAEGDPDIDGDPPRDSGELLVAWALLERALDPAEPLASPDEFGAATDPLRSEPEAAGLPGGLAPRNLFRGLTVWRMKDRAGLVGASGVGPALADMLGATTGKQTRFHLVGHSFGARVLLAATGRSSCGALPRQVDSLLLLQPAVNRLCFAERLANGRPGGFRSVLDAVKQPILSTFSRHDFPLTSTFHLALRRGKDLGEAQIAASGPPSEYAALGGYGPGGPCDCGEVAIKQPMDVYDLTKSAPAIWAVDGSRTISGHGDVVNESTAWALFNLARA